jgi:hypothetical protein
LKLIFAYPSILVSKRGGAKTIDVKYAQAELINLGKHNSNCCIEKNKKLLNIFDKTVFSNKQI